MEFGVQDALCLGGAVWGCYNGPTRICGASYMMTCLPKALNPEGSALQALDSGSETWAEV